MEDDKRSRFRRLLKMAYEKPAPRRWRRDELSVVPGWIFDAVVVVSCAMLATDYFFGGVGVIGALFISVPLFHVMENKKKSSVRKTEEMPAPMPEETAADTESRQPIKTLRVDDCSASIWPRTYSVRGVPTTFYSISFERSYKGRNGEWRYTKSFDLESLGKVITLCQQASEVIRSLQQN